MLPKFPKFKVLELSDRQDIEAFTVKFPPYSDFNFQSMWACGTGDAVKVSVLGGNLILAAEDYLTGSPCLAFLGDDGSDAVANELLEYLRRDGNGSVALSLVPEASIEGLDREKYLIEADPNNGDYVYDLGELARMNGGKYEDKRRKIHTILRSHPDSHAKPLDLLSDGINNLLLEVNERWSESKSKDDSYYHLPKEHAALERFLDAKFTDSVGIGIFSAGHLMGYSIFNILPNGYSICHFSKGRLDTHGVYELLMMESAKILLDHGSTLLNYQEDLGLPGLRFFKRSFRPVDMLMKYTVKPRA